MWLFLPNCFLSIVAARDNPQNLLVRARVAGHIQNIFPKAKVFEMEDADYKYRALISRNCVVKVFSKQVDSIRYDNFKDAVSESAFKLACMRVWGIMRGIQHFGQIEVTGDMLPATKWQV